LVKDGYSTDSGRRGPSRVRNKWKAVIRARFLRDLSDWSANAGMAVRNLDFETADDDARSTFQAGQTFPKAPLPHGQRGIF
jgi:hypothetical protein